MPNWCSNTVNIAGEENEMNQMKDLVQTKDSKFDFDAIDPMPEELKGIHSGSTTIDGESFDLWREVDGENVGVTKAEIKALEEKFGTASWYDWNCQHWGTKWNASDAYDSDAGDNITYGFDTAWAPPLPVLEKLSAKFPNLSIHIRYEEEGCGFWGEAVFKAGKQESSTEGDM
jgi:hypothetical protein